MTTSIKKYDDKPDTEIRLVVTGGATDSSGPMLRQLYFNKPSAW
jgi:hypothetical protein